MQIKDVMMSVVGHVDADTSLRDASATIKSLRLDPIPVMDEGKVVGMVSERDILAVISKDGVGGGMRPVRDVMTADVVCCRPEQSVKEVAEAVSDSPQSGRVERLPVIDEQQQLVGLILTSSLRDASSDEGDGTRAIDAFASIDGAADFQRDPVEYMSDESFPASDPVPPPSTLGPDGDG
jgi:CBS domain-containing protein